MKIPALPLNRDAFVNFLVRHGEKLLVSVVALGAAALAWGGIQSLRWQSVQPTQKADAVAGAAAQAEAHIGSVTEPPAEFLPAREPLPDVIDPWRSTMPPWRSNATLTVTEAPPLAELDRPVFEERARRTKPDVLPVEDLRAVAGIAVLPVAAQAEGAPPGALPPGFPPPAPGGRPSPDLSEPPRRQPPRRGRRPQEPEAPVPMPEMQPPVMAQPGSPGKIVPYIVVTGLIPVEKQRAEYRRRFDGAGYRNQKRDSPLWSDYVLERSVVTRDGKESWERVDLSATLKRWTTQWTGVDSATIPPEFLLTQDAEDLRNPQTTPLPFCSALPQRIDGGWELDGLHPWLTDQLAERAAAAGAEGRPDGLPGIGIGPGLAGPVPGRPDAAGPGLRRTGV